MAMWNIVMILICDSSIDPQYFLHIRVCVEQMDVVVLLPCGLMADMRMQVYDVA